MHTLLLFDFVRKFYKCYQQVSLPPCCLAVPTAPPRRPAAFFRAQPSTPAGDLAPFDSVCRVPCAPVPVPLPVPVCSVYALFMWQGMSMLLPSAWGLSGKEGVFGGGGDGRSE